MGRARARETIEMTRNHAEPLLDEEILEAAFSILDEGATPTEESLGALFPGREGAVAGALDALREYRRRVDETRDPADFAPGVGVLVPGALFGDFLVEGWLGGGGMGGVYRARQRSMGDRAVALKVLSPAMVKRDQRAIARFHREAKLVAGIRHPNLVEVYATGEEQGLSYIAMRLVEGRTLHDVLLELVARRTLEGSRHESREFVRCVVQLVHEVAGSLAAIHARGLVHRDVKPSNILLEGTREGEGLEALRARPVLVDYGLLKPIESSDLTGDQTVLGTAAVVSPEAWLGREVDARSDVFSLGAVLHDLLSLTRPGTRRLAISGLSEVSRANTAVDPRLAAIVGKALEDRPELRYRDGGELAADLERCLDGKSVAALPANPLTRLGLRYRRNPARTLTSVLFVFVLGLLLAGAGYLGKVSKTVYETAAVAAAHDAAGEILEAQESYLELHRSRLAPRLPGLEDVLERAARFAESRPVTELCRRLRGAGENGAVEAHVALQGFLLTPPLDEEWCRTWKRFLWHELRDDELLAHRRRAAETITYFYLVDPRPYGESPRATEEDRRLEERLLELARDTREKPEAIELHRQVLSALSGFPGEASLATFVESMRAEDAETYRLAVQAATRVWYRARAEEKLLELPQRLLVDWVVVVGRHALDPLPRLVPSMWVVDETTFCLLAETRRELRKQGELDSEAWAGIPGELDAYLGRLEEALDRALEGAEVPRIDPFVGEWAPLAGANPAARSGWLSDSLWFEEKDPFSYPNIWSAADEGSHGQPQSVSESPGVPPGVGLREEPRSRVAATFTIDGAEPKPLLEGWAVGLRWEGATPVCDRGQEGMDRYFKLDHPGHSKVSLEALVPERAEVARVLLEHCYSKRAFLPWGGKARVRVTIRPGEAMTELDVPLNRGCVSLPIDTLLLAMTRELEVEVELIAAASNYRLGRLEIEFGWKE